MNTGNIATISSMSLHDFRTLTKKHALVKSDGDTRIVRKNSESGLIDAWMFDFRAVMLRPEWIALYAELFWETFASQYPFQVGGMETGGIPLVTAIVMKGVERGTPVNGFYIRKSRKRDGLMKVVEGNLTSDPVILVDDLINTGSTFLKQILNLKDAGAQVRDIFTVVAYRESSAYAFASENNVRVQSVFTLKDFDLPMLTTHTDVASNAAFTEVWRFTSPQPSHHLVVAKSVPLVRDGLLYFGADDGVFRALHAETGTLSWEFRVGSHPSGKGILSSPAFHRGNIFFGAYDGNIYALDAKTGKKKWVYDDADWVGSSPLIAEKLGLLFIGLEFGLFRKRGGIVAISIETGTRVWDYRSPEFTHATPLYIESENLVVIGSNDGVVYAFNAQNGSLMWRYQTRGSIKSACAYDPKYKVVVAASMDGNVYTLSVSDGTPTAACSTGAGIYGTPLVDGETVYVASLDKHLYARTLPNLEAKWSFATSGRIFASPMLADSSLWIGSNDGVLYELNPKSGASIATFQTSEKIVNKITYDDAKKLIYISTHANEVYCLKRAT